MTSDTTWTLVGLSLCVFLVALCAVAVLSDVRARRAKREWEARPKQTCGRCGDRGVLHMDTHLALAHGERPLGPEDRGDWA